MKRITPILAAFSIVLLVSISSQAQMDKNIHKFHSAKTDHPKLNYDSLYEAATPVDQSSEGKALLESCLEAYGGREYLGKIESMRFQWRLKAKFEKDTINVTKTWAREKKHRTDLIRSSGKIVSRFMVGDSVWQRTPDSLLVMNRNRSVLEIFHSFSTSGPAYLADLESEEIRYGRREGDSLGYLYIFYEEKLIVSVGIDLQTHWIASFEGAVIDADLRQVYIHLFFEHISKDGFLVPQRSVFVSMGLVVGESRFERVEINPEIPDGYYRPQ